MYLLLVEIVRCKTHCDFVVKGNYENNLKHGFGKLTTRNGLGDVYEGPFENGKKHGCGVVTIVESGAQYKVTFRDDENIAQEQISPGRFNVVNKGDTGECVVNSEMNMEDDEDDENSIGNQYSSSAGRRSHSRSIRAHNTNRSPTVNAWE